MHTKQQEMYPYNTLTRRALRSALPPPHAPYLDQALTLRGTYIFV